MATVSRWRRVWQRIAGSSPRRYRRVWRARYGISGMDGPALGFTWDEVRSRDGIDPPRWMRARIVQQANELNRLRYLIAKRFDARRVTISVNSWYRSPAHNAAVGGARFSQHVQGRATDVTISVTTRSGNVRRLSPREVAGFAEQVPAFRSGGVGVYSSFTHLDTRSGRARWSG